MPRTKIKSKDNSKGGKFSAKGIGGKDPNKKSGLFSGLFGKDNKRNNNTSGESNENFLINTVVFQRPYFIYSLKSCKMHFLRNRNLDN